MREEVEQLRVYETPKGYPDYWKCTSKSERTLWLLAFADIHGVSGLRPKEIAFLGSKLKDHLPTRDLNGYTIRNIKAGLITKDKGVFKILRKGIDHFSDTKQTG